MELSESEMIERMKKCGPSLRYIFGKSEDKVSAAARRGMENHKFED